MKNSSVAKAVAIASLAWISACASSAQAGPVPLSDIQPYERAAYDRTVTECDRLTAHPSDPERVSEGVTQDAMDKSAAIEACLEALANDPDNPRLNYQLARAYNYAGQPLEGAPYSNKAVTAGYPQSLFVAGYVRLENWDGLGPDPCYGGELIRRSAEAGRLAGLIGFPHYAMAGRFADCESYPIVDKAELERFLNEAGPRAETYYQSILVQELKEKFEQLE